MIGRFIIALSLTMVVILTYDINVFRVEHKINDLSDQITNMSEIIKQLQDNSTEYVTRDALQPVLEDVNILSAEVDSYRQDIRFWNEHVRELFGDENARYFREGRGK